MRTDLSKVMQSTANVLGIKREPEKTWEQHFDEIKRKVALSSPAFEFANDAGWKYIRTVIGTNIHRMEGQIKALRQRTNKNVEEIQALSHLITAFEHTLGMVDIIVSIHLAHVAELNKLERQTQSGSVHKERV